ncbi:hypothetical protein ABT124_31085 [Streptomyces sp. NPDC001982]|uniref:hypothetical protein n=1 Tax=unclassified Streptomyces TaxID=2593676 RepID=UPI00332DA457
MRPPHAGRDGSGFVHCGAHMAGRDGPVLVHADARMAGWDRSGLVLSDVRMAGLERMGAVHPARIRRGWTGRTSSAPTRT